MIALLALGIAVPALNARPGNEKYPQTEVSASWSFYPRVAAGEFLDGHREAITGGRFTEKAVQGNQIHCSGLYTAEVGFKLKSWFTLGIQVSGASFWADSMNSQERIKGTALYLLPTARFTYVRSDLIKMYSGVGFGLGMQNGFSAEQSVYAGIGGADLDAAFQVVPVGIQMGRDLYGIAELSLGTVNMGLRLGIGYRF